MKNVIIIFLLVALFFSLVFGIYVAGFKYYFRSDRMIKQTKRIARMTFQREANAAKINLSPFGALNVNSFAMAARGGFDAGTTLSVNSLSAKINIIKLLSRELIINNVHIKGINVHLNYENGRKFNYSDFFSNVKYVFMQKAKRQGLLKKVEINSVLIDESNVNLKTDYGLMKFKNIVLSSQAFDMEEPFLGRALFVFEWRAINAETSAAFRYDRENKIIYVEDLVCENLSFSADGKIKLLDGGLVEIEYVVKINKKLYATVLRSIAGFAPDDLITKISAALDDDIIISYPGGVRAR